jgi:hypothetical protein
MNYRQKHAVLQLRAAVESQVTYAEEVSLRHTFEAAVLGGGSLLLQKALLVYPSILNLTP